MRQVSYSSRERAALWTLAILGFVGVNGAFLYGALFVPGALAGALSNPVAAAFVLEATLLLVALAYLLTKWGVNGLGRTWFVVLSLVGSMAFALPAVLLWPSRTDRDAGGATGERPGSA